MSSYRSSQTIVDASVAGAYDLLAGRHDALLAGLCSASAASLAHDVASLQGPIDAAVWSRVDADLPDWATHLPETSTAAMQAAHLGQIPLPQALTTVAADLAVLERLATTDASAVALTDLGYTVDRVDGISTSAIEARRGHETFLVVVRDQGRIETDHLGLADDSCIDRQQDFVDAMGHLGILFDEEVVVQHHDPRGGSPVAHAERAGGRSLAEGAVLDGDARPSSFTTSLLDAHPSVRRQAEGGLR